MKFETFNLLVTLHKKSVPGEYPNSNLWHLSKKQSNYTCNTLFDGLPIRQFLCPVLSPTIKNEFWKSCVEKIIIYDCRNEYDTNFITICYILTPNIIDDLLNQSYTSFDSNPNNNSLRELITETFPDWELIANTIKQSEKKLGYKDVEEELVDYPLLLQDTDAFYSDDYRYPDCGFLEPYLIIRPSQEELLKYKVEESVTDFLLRFEKSINRVISANVNSPYYYVDFIETIPCYYTFASGKHLRLFICTTENIHRDKITIPMSIHQFLEFDIRLKVLKVLKSKIGRLYSNEYDIERYVASISKEDIFKNYSVKFKDERIKYIQTKFDAERIVDSFKGLAETSIPYSLKDYYDKLELYNINQPDNGIRSSLLRDKNNEFDSLTARIQQSMEIITRKDTYINEYIRDIISVDSTWTNLKLQKTVKFLTYLTIILGLLSLLVTLYTNEIKSFIKTILN